MTDVARFRVDDAFNFAARGTYFVLGDVVAGELRAGMTAEAPSFAEPIHCIESADSQGRSWVTLGFRYADVADRDRWHAMDWHGVTLSIPAAPVLHPCPCCGFHALAAPERGSFEICGVCGWEDDWVQYRDPTFRGGANAESLHDARAAFFADHPHLVPTRHG